LTLRISALAQNPFGFEYSDLFEDMINTFRATKNFCFERLGINRPSTGFTIVDLAKMPVINVEVEKLVIELLDDPFEMALSRNYRLGYQEQSGRLNRDKAFQKKASSIRSSNFGVITRYFLVLFVM
jgi:hypothetical protein